MLIDRCKILIFFLFIPMFLAVQPIPNQADQAAELVYIIPIENDVERGLEAFLKRTTNQAIDEGVDHIIYEIDTPGGRVDSAGQIATLLQNVPVPTTSFIINQALSAGSYIALNTDNIYMAPHATMGASGVINEDGTAADKKAQSAWRKAMKSAAESKDRDPLYAEAMADDSIDLPEYGAPKGDFLTLGPKEALEVEYANGIMQNRQDLLYELQLDHATIIETEPTIAEQIARFVTNPIVISILLSVASLGLIVELYSPGFGVPGTMGLIALGLFFYGHIIAEFAGAESILLLLVGIGLIVTDFFTSSGILGLLGAGSIVGSLYLAGYDVTQMTFSIAIALIVAILLAVILFRYIGLKKGLFKHIVLSDRTTTESGYVSAENRNELVGKIGYTVTQLRPSGTALINDERLDVVSEGTFIEKNQQVKVVKVEGSRVVVRLL